MPLNIYDDSFKFVAQMIEVDCNNKYDSYLTQEVLA